MWHFLFVADVTIVALFYNICFIYQTWRMLEPCPICVEKMVRSLCLSMSLSLSLSYTHMLFLCISTYYYLPQLGDFVFWLSNALLNPSGPFPDTPVICTLPVLKMSHMVLYDHYLRLKSEGTRLKSKRISTDTPGSRAVSMLQNSTGLDLTLDDIDDSLEHARMVKFGQRAEIVLSKC